ncbi:glutamate synthase [Acidihalobacter aeolianus]|uniref:Glutamate synthase n=1 Tax=Acidihalobacter aeolianus TaxID=2792603 RepID=A0A1D8K5P7_9GAMM|nr:FMN-binding glutamate synthase family protein [Acidihalobacter aeolianus]AOV16272.1 glutamate synthase [Acidihalobacter aeolianus]
MDPIMDIVRRTPDILATSFILVVGLVALGIVVLFAVDLAQTSNAIRHNFPVLGRFRGLFTKLGEFFRQYFFALDREELPFNRAEREWIYRSARGGNNTVAFGSTQPLLQSGTVLFVNSPYPVLERDAHPSPPLLIGAGCPQPYAAPSLINISGMSYGAISAPAVRALSQGAALAGCWMNTGEGGLSPYHLEGGCDLVFQIGTAKYGVRETDGRLSETRLREIADHPQVRMFEIKLSQGAKPGKGGILPAAKVTPEIARIRGIEPGTDSLSPNRHPEIGDSGELLEFIAHVRAVTGKPTGIKFVLGNPAWLDELGEAIRQRGIESAPDFITVDGAEGGTGAAPLALIDAVGLPLRHALPAVVDALERHGLRERVRIVASGKLVTPVEMAWAFCAGADFVVSARGFMFALGCIQALRCNRNTCPTGITTHNARLQRGLDPREKSVRVANYVAEMRHGLETIAHSCGAAHPRALTRQHCLLVGGHPQIVPLAERLI